MGCAESTERKAPAVAAPVKEQALPAKEDKKAAASKGEAAGKKGGKKDSPRVSRLGSMGRDGRTPLSGRKASLRGTPTKESTREVDVLQAADPVQLLSVLSIVSLDDGEDAAAAPLDVDALYKHIDDGQYAEAFKGFKKGTTTGSTWTPDADVDYVKCVLGMTVLHGLGGNDWKSPDVTHDIGKTALNQALKWLHGRTCDESTAASAYMAMAEYYHSTGAAEDEERCRISAAESHPLGELKLAAYRLKTEEDDEGDDVVDEDTAAMEAARQTLYKLATQNKGLVAGRAAKVSWGHFYKNKKDLYKAATLLRIVLQYEPPGPVQAQYQKKLNKVEAKIENKLKRADTAGGGSMMRSPRRMNNSSVHGSPSLRGLSGSPTGGSLRRAGSVASMYNDDAASCASSMVMDDGVGQGNFFSKHTFESLDGKKQVTQGSPKSPRLERINSGRRPSPTPIQDVELPASLRRRQSPSATGSPSGSPLSRRASRGRITNPNADALDDLTDSDESPRGRSGRLHRSPSRGDLRGTPSRTALQRSPSRTGLTRVASRGADIRSQLQTEGED
eukprot:TRINITY_DN27618_c0_g1_i1.p1 TRINITY_DN27618_c0_g1~~TRINITY_DN27618_c0_g1_i1.p1  ORF type:complete len:579 (+),score=128.99 TRINITY_DN27618_c0_g1_i1:60-1739(+)